MNTFIYIENTNYYISTTPDPFKSEREWFRYYTHRSFIEVYKDFRRVLINPYKYLKSESGIFQKLSKFIIKNSSEIILIYDTNRTSAYWKITKEGYSQIPKLAYESNLIFS